MISAKLVLFLLLMANPGKDVQVEQDRNVMIITIDDRVIQILHTEIK